jgi:hypothetical protein
MKKSLLGLLVALVAFFVGVLMVKITPSKTVTIPNTATTEIDAATMPVLKYEPLYESLDQEKKLRDKSSDVNLFSGWYGLEDFGNMKEVDFIVLSRAYGYHEDSDKLVSYAAIFTTPGENIEEGIISSRQAEVIDNKVKFRTNRIKGIEYRFEGTFFKNRMIGENGEELLRGTLKKYIKGKKVAEIGGDFAYYEPHCWR